MVALEPTSVAVLVPAHEQPPSPRLLDDLAGRVGTVLVVADGMSQRSVDELRRRASSSPVEVLELAQRSGKGTAVAAGIELLLARTPTPDAVVVVDADGQHPPEAIPRFLEAGRSSELVIGDRFGDLRSIPPVRRAANLATALVVALAAGRRVRDTQCGMRLLRGRALHDVRFPRGGYEAETVHLRHCLAAGVPVAWVPIPALYGPGATSSFRPIRDGLRVARAAIAGARGARLQAGARGRSAAPG